MILRQNDTIKTIFHHVIMSLRLIKKPKFHKNVKKDQPSCFRALRPLCRAQTVTLTCSNLQPFEAYFSQIALTRWKPLYIFKSRSTLFRGTWLFLFCKKKDEQALGDSLRFPALKKSRTKNVQKWIQMKFFSTEDMEPWIAQKWS